ncbi:MAG: hypothetical protein ACO2XQ_00900 [Flavobacteriales bacterium]
MKRAFTSTLIGFGMLIGLQANLCAQVSESLLFELTTDPRGAALGGSVMADFEDDLHAAAYNPCLLDTNQKNFITLDYVDYFAGIGLATVNIQLTNGKKWKKQVGTRFLNLGQFDGFDGAGNPTGSFNGGENFVYFGASRPINPNNPNWSIGTQSFIGTRSLDREVSAWAGTECFVHGKWPESRTAIGVALTGMGRQWNWKSSQPNGALPYNLQLALTKGFQNAPFTVFLKAQHLETWDLAPPGTYDDTIDPITGEVVQNKTFKFGDQLMRHMNIGVAIKPSSTFQIWTGFDYRRRKELMATDRLSANGLSLGVEFKMGNFDIRMSRSRYHFAGASTHIGLRFNPRQFNKNNRS